MFIILFFAPPVLVIIASYILYEGLRNLSKIHWKKIGIASCLLVIGCIFLIIGIATDLSYGVIYVLLFATLAAMLSGFFLSIVLPRWRKLVGLLIGLGVPILMFISINIGHPLDPTIKIRSNGETIAEALNKYHSDVGTYPETLDKLVPDYISDLNEPKQLWGWLYIANRDEFTLGYVDYIDKFGYTICKYSATTPEWNCPKDNSTEPFQLAPTPISTFRP